MVVLVVAVGPTRRQAARLERQGQARQVRAMLAE